MTRPRLIHVTTADISLSLLLGPQLRAFRDAGYEVIGASAPGPFVADLESWGIEHRPLRHATRSMAPHRDAAALAELYRLFRDLRPAIVHTHNPKPGVYGRLAARAARVPAIVNTVHGLYALPEDRWRKRAVVYSLERIAAWGSDAELVQNPEDIDTLRRIGVPARKVHLLGNGVDLARFIPPDPTVRAAVRAELGAGPDTVVCGVVGRLVWEKGYREVFDAARRLRARAPEVMVVVVGPEDPAKADGVDAGALAAARADGVRFLGMREDVERLYAGMDLYVLASYREGFPRSAMEAAASGLPVIATDIRGCRQVVDHGRTGLLVPAREAVALAEAVATIASDADLRRTMARRARDRAVAEFDQTTQIRITLETYSRLLGSAAP
ncbi:MAG: glycosyltransferase family 4 protein [Actinomycetota bacterium]